MEETGAILDDADAALEQAAVERLGRVVQQRVFDLPLQHDGHGDVAAGGVAQGLAETPAGQEIGHGDEDFAARVLDGGEIGLFDVAPVAQVVPDHEGGSDGVDRIVLPAGTRRRRRRPAPEARPADQPPQMPHGGADRCDERPFDAHGIVEARPEVGRVAVVQIVDDVDAADEGDAAVDGDQLAVQPPQAVAAQPEGGEFGAIDLDLDAGIRESAAQAVGELARAEAIDEHAHRDAAPCRRDQRGRDLPAGRIVGVDVGFEVDFAGRRLDGGEQRRKVLCAGFQQRDAVAAQKVGAHGTAGAAATSGYASRADSAAWSEIDDHGGP